MPEILCGHCGGRHSSVADVRQCAVDRPVSALDRVVDGVELGRAYDAALEPKVELEEDTLYKIGDIVYKTTRSKSSGRLYASRMTTPGKWEYAPGAMKLIKPESRMSLEEAATYGRLTGQCIVCGRKLTDAHSVEAGIGPICAERF